METITIIYTKSNGATRMKMFKLQDNWVKQCEELDSKYSNWRVV